MSEAAIPTQGTLLKAGNGASPEVFTAIGEVQGITGPNKSRTFIDTTDLASSWVEGIVGLKDGGEVTFDVQYTGADAQFDALVTSFNNGTLRNYKVELTDSPATTYSFAAYVLAIGSNVPKNDRVVRPVTLRISGAVVEA
jgi:hypothetical protein